MEHRGAESGLVSILYGFWVPLIQPNLIETIIAHFYKKYKYLEEI